MADYFPLLARALDALPDRSPALRKAVYDRARHALISQLRSLDPPLTEEDIDLERRALDKAIDRLESERGGLPAPAPANDIIPAPAPAAPPPRPEPSAAAASADEIPEPSPTEDRPPPGLPAAAAPRFVPIPSAEPQPREAPIAITPRRQAPAKAAAALPDPEPRSDARRPPVPADPTIPDAGTGRQRPRIAVVPPKAGRSRVLRNAFVGIVLAVVIGLIAVAAFLLRDRPQTLQANGPETASKQGEGEAKFADRVGGDAAPAERATPRPDTAAPARGQSPTAQATAVSVAQRATLIEENAGSGDTPPTTRNGRVTWRLETVNGEQGQPLQTAVVATVTIPDAGMTLVMTLQRNLDATLPASHTVSLAFTLTGSAAAGRTVQDVGLLQAKDDESARGSPLSGLPVRVRENLFLIGLSSLGNDVERNTDLLLHRNWFDLAISYTSRRRAVLTFEKGAAGTQVLQNAFDAWP